MSEITQPPPDVQTQDPNSRVNRLNAASDQSASHKQSAEQQAGKNTAEAEVEKQVSHHDPAVTLASTLAKLDSGSHFAASVSGHDADGRTIIVSDLGTYLVDADQKYAEDLKNIRTDADLNIRVVTVDKEIKAEIIRPPIENAPALAAIPVELTLTDIAANPGQTVPSTPPARETPLEDVRSQYQATTLYKAERIAREIADKLDNLPLPTTSPNYTVYGSSSVDNDKAANLIPRRFSPNVSIQEVASPSVNQVANSATATSQVALEQILGQNINVQVIKAVPKTPIPLPPGLPEAVIKEISALTPLDYVQQGQNLNINIAAIAVPDAQKQSSEVLPPPVQNVETAAVSLTKDVILTPPAILPQIADTTHTQAPVKDAVISGIIIDAAQKSSANVAVRQDATQVTGTPYNQKNTPQILKHLSGQAESTRNTYYLATPTTVLKLQSNTPLVPGTIVSFTVVSDNPAQQSGPNAKIVPEQTPPLAASQNTQSNPVNTNVKAGTTQPSTTTAPELAIGSVSPPLLDKIEQFVPQGLDQLPDDWVSISMALGVLTSSSSTSAAAIMASRIPNLQSPEQITSTMFFFLSALKAPQPARAWLGPDVSAKLKQLGAAKLIDHVNGDMTRIARLGGESPVGEWRPLLIPIQNGPEITAVPMLTRQIVDQDQKKQSQGEKSEDDEIKVKATRFILEIKFSQFGMVLVDGLIKGTRLDIILKSAKAIPFAVKMKLSKRYSDALKNNSFDGELVVIDNSPSEVSVRKMMETLSHNTKYEKKI